MENMDIKPQLLVIKKEYEEDIDEEPNVSSYNEEYQDIKPRIGDDLPELSESVDQPKEHDIDIDEEANASSYNEEYQDIKPRIGVDIPIIPEPAQQAKEFKCKICQEVYKTGPSLKRHFLVHRNKQTNKCELCQTSFGTSKLLNDHMKLCTLGVRQGPDLDVNDDFYGNNDKTEYTCEFCPKIFYSNVSIRDHMQLHIKPDAFKCNICSATFTHLRSLQYHQKNHTRTKKFECSDCGKAFYHLCNLKDHMALHSETLVKELTCNFCKKIFSTKKNLRSHCESRRCRTNEDNPEKSEPTIYKCKFCEEKFDNMASIKDHLLKHETKKKIFVCSLCDSKFEEEEKLNEHEDMHRSDCPDETELQEFKDHLAKMRRQKIQHFNCKFCPKVFSCYQSIADHVELHQNPTAFKCNVCSASFTHNRTLLLHMRTHQEHENYPCTLCGRIFIRENSLKLHLIAHRKPELVDMTCKFCDKLLRSRENLEKHILTCLLNPNRKKQFSCDQCGKVYATSYDLRMHLLKHGPGTTQTQTQSQFGLEPMQTANMANETESQSHHENWSQYMDSPAESTSNVTIIDEPSTVKEDEDFIGPDDGKMQNYDSHEFISYSDNDDYYEEPKFKKEKIDENASTYNEEPKIKKEGIEEEAETENVNAETQEAMDQNAIEEEVRKEALKCRYCHKVFNKKATLGSHVFLCRKIVHDRKDNACTLCNKAFMNIKLLDEHELMHNSPNLYKCQDCPQKFMTIMRYLKHTQESHNSVEKTNLTAIKCKFCPKTFETTSHLLLHEKWHSNPNVYTCPVCQRKFHSRYTYNNHLPVHVTLKHDDSVNLLKKKFPCDQCDKSYDAEPSLKRHKIIHELPKYMCQFCPKKFHSLKNHEEHEIWHSNPGSMKCEVCDKQYQSQWGLTLHLRQVHKINNVQPRKNKT